MVVVDVAVFGSGADLAPTNTIRAHRVFVFHDPGTEIEHVNVLFDIEVAGEPREVIPIAHVIFHVGPFRLAWLYPDRAAKVIRLKRPNMAERPFMDALNDFAMAIRIADSQAGDDGQIFLSCSFADREHFAHARGIYGHRLLGKNVLAGLDGSLHKI